MAHKQQTKYSTTSIYRGRRFALQCVLSRPPIFLGEGSDDDEPIHGGEEGWVRRRWWYKLAHVCQDGETSHSALRPTWIFDSFVHQARMLQVHYPVIPFIIDYVCGDFDVCEEDEEGLLLALKRRRDRVRHVRPSDGCSESTELRHG